MKKSPHIKAGILSVAAHLLSSRGVSAAVEGDSVCITGYIMDHYCIEDTGGVLLDDSSVTTLQNPEKHSFHCLLDVPRCYESGFQVLGPKDPETDRHCLGYRLGEAGTQTALAAGRAIGKKGNYPACTECTGTMEDSPIKGYRATIRGTIADMGDGSEGLSGTPLLKDVEVLDEGEACESPPACAVRSAPAPAPSAGDVKVGDEVCITNYIMDKFCIDLGHFKDNPDGVTLMQPEDHSFHCLLDVADCKNSGYLVLTDKNEDTGMHCLGYRLEETERVLEAGLAAGAKGTCTDCTGDSSKPSFGYRATIKGTVKALGDGTYGVSGTPVLQNIQVLDADVECDIPTVVNPVCMPEPTPAPVPEPGATPSLPAGLTLSCPDTLDKLKVIDDSATLHYAMVPSDPSGSNNGLLCGRLEAAHDGWIALALSSDGKMQGSTAIIGLPADDTVLKYDLVTYGANAVSNDKQTLRDVSIVEEDGMTIMTFTKLLVEPGEIEIKESGANIMLHARGGDALAYHGPTPNRLDFTLDFAAPSVEVGDKVCITNYIMDQYCINLGHFLDNPEGVTLREPEEHSFHCLLDVSLCKDSGYVVLTDKNEDTGMHCIGYRLDDTDAVLEAGLAAGRFDDSPGGCIDCTGDSSKPERGYRATVIGTVKALGDGSSGASGAPLLGDIEVLDAGVSCDIPTIVDPVCMSPPTPPPQPAPTPVKAPGAAKDCSQEFCNEELAPGYSLSYKVNVPDDTTLEVCEGCTITMELTYDGEAWVAIGFSEDGKMIGSEAVIGSPDFGVQKFQLGGKSPSDVTPMEKQTLTDTDIDFVNGQTIMKFTKIMVEEGEIPISPEDNTFIWAHGTSNALDTHRPTDRASFSLNLSSGASEAGAVPNKAAWLAHGIMAFLAWGVFVPFAVQSSLLRNLLPSGPLWFNLHRAFNATAYALFIAVFAVGVAYVQKEGGIHFDNNHERMGLAMFIIATLQVLGGAFRPHLPAPDSGEEKTQVRKGWEVGHRLFGVALLACGFWQMQEGIKLFVPKYSVSESDQDKVLIAYWVWIGVMSAIIVFGGALKFKNISSGGNDAAPPTAAADGDEENPRDE